MTRIPNADKKVLRELGRQIAAAAADPVNNERRVLHQRIDNRQRARPTIHIYQEPWSELNRDHELDLQCEDSFCRRIEVDMRQSLYKWRHYPGDMVMDAVSIQPYCISDSGFGITEDVDVVRTDAANSVVSRHTGYPLYSSR